MAATQNLPKEADENFGDVEVGHDGFTRSEEYAPVSSKSHTYTRPPYVKSSAGAGCRSHVEVWINEEFGDDGEASHKMHDEADFYATLIQQVDEYIETMDYSQTAAATDSIFDDHLEADSEDSEESEMCYEPQLWSFT